MEGVEVICTIIANRTQMSDEVGGGPRSGEDPVDLRGAQKVRKIERLRLTSRSWVVYSVLVWQWDGTTLRATERRRHG